MSTEVPEIEIDFVGINEHGVRLYEAKCPLLDCRWEVNSHEMYSDLEEQVFAHEQWHGDGMPE